MTHILRSDNDEGVSARDRAELAFAETESGNHERSLELCRAAHELRPDAGPVAHGFAHALLETGRGDEGMSWSHDWLDR